MLKKSLKYLLIAAINFIVLTVLLALWTDELELLLNDWVRPIEFLKIIGFTLTSLVSMRILVYYFRRRNITHPTSKIRIAIFLTILVSSYLYVDYTSKLISNKVINRELRKHVAAKIKPAQQLANGTRAEGLTQREYQVITQITGFPKLPAKASQISYSYEYDGFLPDYSFSLTYDLPLESEIDTVHYQNIDFSKTQTFEIVGDKKRVRYNEYEQ